MIPLRRRRGEELPADFVPDMSLGLGRCRFPLFSVSQACGRRIGCDGQSRNGLTETSTWPIYVCGNLSAHLCNSQCEVPHVDLAMFKPLLQVIVDGLVGHLAKEGEI